MQERNLLSIYKHRQLPDLINSKTGQFEKMITATELQKRGKVMESTELVELMGKIEAKGIVWEKVEEEAKISHDLLKLYAVSGPVPVTLINKLKTLVEA